MEQLRIDLVPMGVTPNAHASQFDVGRVIRFLLYNGGTVYTLAGTETITVKMSKPDGTEETVSVTNTSSNYVDFVTTDGLLNQVGLYPCEISIVNGTDVIGSQNFNLRAEADAYDGAGVVTVTVGPADICTFTTTLAEPLQSVTVDIEATGGNGTPDNPNPINGYTEAKITRCGVNLWDEEYQLGEIYPSGAINPDTTHLASLNYIKVKPSTSYRLVGIRAQVGEYDRQKNFIGIVGNSYIGTNGGSVEFTTSANTEFLLFNAAATYGTTYNNDISINYPATDTAYHPYTGNTYTIAFGQTVYGGVLDVTRGKLRVTHEIVDMGDLAWSANTYQGVVMMIAYYTTHRHEPYELNCKCDIYECSNDIWSSGTLRDKIFCNNYTGTSIYVYDSNYTDANTFKTAVTGHKICYELATPFDIDLTPEVILAVVGENNVFADCGDIEIKYLTTN